MQNKPNRRKSRAVAMEILYSGTVNSREDEITDEFLEDFLELSDTTETIDPAYISRVVKIAGEHDGFLNEVIRRYLKEWTLERISRVNLAILKIAASEIFFMDDIPERVSLNEAIELAKTYSDEESQAFINAVLDRMIKGLKDGSLILPTEGDTETPQAQTAEGSDQEEQRMSAPSDEPMTFKEGVTAPDEVSDDDTKTDETQEPLLTSLSAPSDEPVTFDQSPPSGDKNDFEPTQD